MTSKQQQYLAYVLFLSRGVGSVATARIYAAIKQAGLDDHEVGSLLLAGKMDCVAHVFGRYAEAIDLIVQTQDSSTFEELLDGGPFMICPFNQLLPSYYWERAIEHRLPLIFMAQGTPPSTSQRWIAVIGSRNAGEQGLIRARNAGASIAANGDVVVSGGARGVDSAATGAAHQAAGMTVVVPAGDLSCVNEIERQLVLSPYAPGTRFSPGLAMARNGVVVALSRSVIVAEVSGGVNGALSGTEHAVCLARDYGVDVALTQA